jgi:glycerol-1-phosphate dehydrogenase [NAD(P)+]
VVAIDLAGIIAPFAESLDTREVVIDRGLLEPSARILARHLPSPGTWVIVADGTTLEVAGNTVLASLDRAGVERVLHVVPSALGAAPVADEVNVDLLAAALAETGAVAAVAVGSGTVNDITKAAAHRLNLPCAVVATAPSMNGYTSAIAAILTDGVKTTQQCRAPRVCIADSEIAANAPYRMVASGLGDLVSKPVSNADWRLAHLLVGASYSPKVMQLVERGNSFLEGVPARLPTRDPDAAGLLMASLAVSGLAMAAAGSSSPASGGEHLISHYLDMTHHAFGEPHDLHGCQVGVATVTTAAIYEKLIGLDPASIDVDALVAAHPEWSDYENTVRRRFGKLADAVVEHACAAHPSRGELRRRLELLRSDWGAIVADVSATLEPALVIRQLLVEAECPLTFAEIGVTPERARRAVRWSKDIRARYTILHLAAELGLLERWSGQVLQELHGIV